MFINVSFMPLMADRAVSASLGVCYYALSIYPVHVCMYLHAVCKYVNSITDPFP